MLRITGGAILAIGVAQGAGAATLLATGTLSRTFTAPSVAASTITALDTLLPGSVAVSYVFEVDETVVDTNPNPDEGHFPASISFVSMTLNGFTFAANLFPCINPDIDCQISTVQTPGPVVFAAGSEITQSAGLRDAMLALTGATPAPFGLTSIFGSFFISGVTPTDPNVQPDLRGTDLTGSLSLFLAPPFGSGVAVENRVVYETGFLTVTDFVAPPPPTPQVPLPGGMPLMAGALGLAALLRQRWMRSR